jgi:cytochrome P450
MGGLPYTGSAAPSLAPPGPNGIGLLDFCQAAFVSPAPLLHRLVREYGDPFRTTLASGPMTFTGEPEAIRALYTADPDTLEPWGVEASLPVFGRTSLPVSSDARHRRDRKLLGQPFNAGSMRAWGATMVEVARAAGERWARGERFRMLETTQDITLDVIVRVVFGVEGKARIAWTREAVLGLIEALNPLVLIFPKLRRDFGGFGPWAKNQRARAALDALLAEEIRERRRGEDERRKDVLSLMLRARYDDGSAMTETELVEQLRAILFAGHETTAVALAWAFQRLYQEPEHLGRVLLEIDALGDDPDPDALASLPFLEAVCMEVLRMSPPVVDVARTTRAPFALGPYTIPPGEGVRASPLLLHARPELYPEPERFRPSRFLERKFSPFEYIPFGGGARRCLGAAFAIYEMKVVLGTLLHRYRLRPGSLETPMHVRRGLTLGPRGGVPMVLLEERAA